jgi:hypothetical protein
LAQPGKQDSEPSQQHVDAAPPKFFLLISNAIKSQILALNLHRSKVQVIADLIGAEAWWAHKDSNLGPAD